MAQAGYKNKDQGQVHFVPCTVVQWVGIFTRSVYADLVIESLKFCISEKGMSVHSWVLMPPSKGSGWQKFTAGKILKELEKSTFESRKSWLLWLFKSAGSQNTRNETYQFWQQDNHR